MARWKYKLAYSVIGNNFRVILHNHASLRLLVDLKREENKKESIL